MATGINVRDGESLDRALRRFNRELRKSGIMKEAEKHRYYEKPSVRKRRQAQEARNRRKRDD